MKRKLCLLLSIVMVLCMCSGCGVVQKIKIDKKGNAKTCSEVYITEDEEPEDGVTITTNGVELTKENYKGKKKVNGVTYSVYAGKWEKMGAEDDNNDIESYTTYTKTKFIMDIPASIEDSSSEDSGIGAAMLESMMSGFDFYKIKVTFPKAITKTNGKLSKDKKTVTFDLVDAVQNNIKLYAYTNKK